MAIYAIGDVQGCYQALKRLLDECGFKPAKGDRLWFCGDLVNRGPQSLDVLRYVTDLGDRACTVLGNHDLNLLAVANGTRAMKAADTLQPILDVADADALLQWLRGRPLLHRDDTIGWCLVHAGLHPDWDVEQASQLAGEVEAVLQGPDYPSLLETMYGNAPDRWSDDLAGWERLRFITNTMTRMRYLDATLRLDFDVKCAPGHQPAGLRPWFSYPDRRGPGWRVVYGHWSTLGLHQQNQTLCLDSGCLWGGSLSAARLTTGESRLYSVSCT